MSDLTIDPTRTALVRIEFGERIHPYGILKGVVDGNAFVKGT